MRVPEVSTIASLSDEWVAAVRDSGRFSEYNWDEQITAGVTTPDELVAKHGEPAFVKIDVERYEADVLAGLSRPVRALSLEYVPEFSAAALTCIDRLVGLGFVEFNFTGEHSLGFVWEAWLPGGEVKEGLAAESEWGDVYACRDRHQPSSVGISRAHLKGQ